MSGLVNVGKNWVIIGIAAITFIVVAKIIVNKYPAPDQVKDIVNAV